MSAHTKLIRKIESILEYILANIYVDDGNVKLMYIDRVKYENQPDGEIRMRCEGEWMKSLKVEDLMRYNVDEYCVEYTVYHGDNVQKKYNKYEIVEDESMDKNIFIHSECDLPRREVNYYVWFVFKVNNEHMQICINKLRRRKQELINSFILLNIEICNDIQIGDAEIDMYTDMILAAVDDTIKYNVSYSYQAELYNTLNTCNYFETLNTIKDILVNSKPKH